MSEAVTPQETPSTPVSEPAPRKGGSGLALLALLVGAAGLAAGGWGIWQVQQMQARDQQRVAQLEDARGQAQSAQNGTAQLGKRIDALPSADELEARRRLVVELQGDQQQLAKQLKQVLGQSRQQWRLAEAEHLLRLASLRLSALQDVESATELVQGADDILRMQNDPGAFAARAQLAKSLEALRSLPRPDRTGLFLQLGALRDQAAQLQPLDPVFKADESGSATATAWGDGSSTWDQWWERISRYVRIDFNAGQDIRPLLSGQQLDRVRLALSLALEQAQWAALNGKQEVYQQALKQARQILGDFFNADLADSRALAMRLDELSNQAVTVQAPDLGPALSSLQAYLARRDAAAAQQEAAAPDAGAQP
ncbi:uroporphyrinogen-III C-methyltransferase [Pseudomonas sp. ZM23]|uniref:Uroporphyrinogen-III C-methyltransferase n=1 Tax=Pseudomonas triclosanedens TaxID=2961893 RepID=A0ABY6ZYV0_9PSED|nr:uroporphyrinogen-III C-methyltransferase [Pseudomonas triclosanedens]MCP8462812.1 uroporphyrinogen-III C-methyltransferase [Pseudomonas triclosanedens]MCP8468432.1 uroporphyrinogen-III C-methyltransferase [Pseudomonas triclosanedens]MCP8475153.1 uroporphyrinogen-III C-methyltransferase [Pseudomonas triclosanedens]WAI49993.1 uroporphyrinogen-III C-methyltransferase [Pseudomonas triclosanedens]